MDKSFSMPIIPSFKTSRIKKYMSADLGSKDPFTRIFQKFKMDIERISTNKMDKSGKVDIIKIKFIDDRLGYTLGNSPIIYKLLWGELKTNSMSEYTHLYLLEQFGILRKKIVDSMIKSSIEELKCNICTYESLGSTSLTSDYDINLTSDLPYINIRVIEIFNKKFFSVFKQTSDTVFDTNIYGIGFLPKSKRIMPSSDDYDSQMVFAFAKLVILEKKYKMNLFDQFPSLSEYKYYYDLAKKKIPVNGRYTSLLSDIQKFMGQGVSLSKFVKESDDKKLYILKDMISTANMYANETYFTQGAFLHVVSSLQGNISLNISKNDYILSCVENLFDIMKEYVLHIDNEDPYIFLLHSYKYIYRFYHAAYNAGLHNNKKLLKIFKDLDEARKKKNNKEYLDSIQKTMDKMLGVSSNTSFMKRSTSCAAGMSSKRLTRHSSLPKNLCNSPRYYMTAFIQMFKKFDIPATSINSGIVDNILEKVNEMGWA